MSMDRGVAIVGAGQAGLHLALSLQAAGCPVRLVSDRTGEQIRSGRVMSTQAMFGPARALERDAGLALWDDKAPDVTWMRAMLAVDAVPQLEIATDLEAPEHSVDQRVKIPAWLEMFEQRGGTVEYGAATPDTVAGLAARHDLTVVAAGRGPLADLFARNDARSPFAAPQRTLACIYLHGVTPMHRDAAADTSGGEGFRVDITPGAGELFLQPALTTSGPCMALMWAAVPGGMFDTFADRPDPDAMLARSLDLIRRHIPWEYDSVAHAQATDPSATLFGAIVPIVRHPVAHLGPNATPVLGMADSLVVNDPLTGQGANNAARCAALYAHRIAGQAGHDAATGFDTTWMHDTFDAFWQHARHSVDFTTAMLRPTPPHIAEALAAAAAHPDIAAQLARTYADPAEYATWLASPEITRRYLGAHDGAPAKGAVGV
jgi:hypothetical protein